MIHYVSCSGDTTVFELYRKRIFEAEEREIRRLFVRLLSLARSRADGRPITGPRTLLFFVFFLFYTRLCQVKIVCWKRRLFRIIHSYIYYIYIFRFRYGFFRIHRVPLSCFPSRPTLSAPGIRKITIFQQITRSSRTY